MLHAEAAAALLEPEPLPWRALRVALPMHRPGAARCAARSVRAAVRAVAPPHTHPTGRQP
jgi:quercetin dioxygenase-like cupin family protein